MMTAGNDNGPVRKGSPGMEPRESMRHVDNQFTSLVERKKVQISTAATFGTDTMKKDESRTKRELFAEVEELRGLIARHRETEARLRETEELYRNLADSSPVGLYLLVQGKFHFLNAQFERSTGYRTDELIGQDALFMVHPEDRET